MSDDKNTYMEDVVPPTQPSAPQPQQPKAPVPTETPNPTPAPAQAPVENTIPDWMKEESSVKATAPYIGTAPIGGTEQVEPEKQPKAMYAASKSNTAMAAEAIDSTPSVSSTLRFVDDNKIGTTKTESDKILDTIMNENVAEPSASEDAASKLAMFTTIPLSSQEVVGESIISSGRSMGPQAFQDAFKDSGSYIAVCRDALEHFNVNSELMRHALNDVKDKITDNTKTLKEVLQRNVGNIGATTTKGTPDVLTKNKRVTGKDAAILMASMTQGLKRVPLWNSGIYVTLRALSLKEIVSFYSTVNFNSYEYGRSLGAWYFLYADIDIKKNVLEQLLPYAISGSTYKNWRNVKKLLSVISIQDYDVILWAFASMMYRDGVPVRLVCAHPDCQHVEEITADLSKMRFVDTSKLNPEVYAYMSETEKERNDRDLADYRKMLNLKETFKFKVANKATTMTSYWEIDFDAASCASYLAYGEMFNTLLFEQIQTPSLEDMREYLAINYYKAYLPWISEIRCVEKEDFDQPGRTSEQRAIMIIDGTRDDNREALMNILDITQMEDTAFAEAILKYIRTSRLTYIALPYFSCVRCGREPSTAVDGFIPYDVEFNFFQLCLMRMLAVKE